MRFVQAAMTPIRFKDIYYALIQHINKRGLDEFKDAINSYLGANSSYTFTSFVRAIYACLESLKRVDKRKEIILPRYCCPDFTRSVLAVQLKIKYCDINPITLSLDTGFLREMNFENVLALICVNHFGFANPMDEIMDLCKRNDIYLIEDLGYALGTEFKNQKLGTFGDFAVHNIIIRIHHHQNLKFCRR
ncbi:dTDP-4-amino-4,6-dideoxygalactose transaminase [subsurface metagenome]